jgi:hypothetical protein
MKNFPLKFYPGKSVLSGSLRYANIMKKTFNNGGGIDEEDVCSIFHSEEVLFGV